MGGVNSGRRSIKAKAIFCILDIQMVLHGIKYEGIQGNKTLQEIEAMVDEGIQTCKVKQEEIEREKVQ